MSENKSIFISTGSMQAGGTERVISILADKFAGENFSVKIFIWRSLPVFYSLPLSVEVVDLPKYCDHQDIYHCACAFRKILKKNRPDLILGFSAPFNMLTLVSASGLNIKTVVCERNDPRRVPFKGYQRVIRNILYYFADGILTQTYHNKEYFSKTLQKKVSIIYNPIFMSEAQRGSAINSNAPHRIVSVARLKKQKNQAMLIRAFGTFSVAHPDYELVIIGEGEERNQLECLIKDLNIKDKVKLPGVSDKVFNDISNAEFFVLSSNFEGMPNTLIEAMCVGLPCISTRVSGATDLIVDRKNGLLVDVGNEEQMTKALAYFSDNANERNRMAKNAMQIYNQLNVDKIAAQWVKYINKIILP